MDMKTKSKTKVVITGGSLRTTVPKKIAELLNIKEGDLICWNLSITDDGTSLTLKKEDES